MKYNYDLIEKTKISEMGWRISDLLKPIAKASYKTNIAFAYAAYLCQDAQIDNADDFKTLIDEIEIDDIRLYIKEVVGEDFDYVAEVMRFNHEELEEYILYENSDSERFTYEVYTPDCLNKLVIELLNIESNEKVGDLGSGMGSFLVRAAKAIPNAYFQGIEISTIEKTISTIRAVILGGKISISQGDMFDITPQVFDKAFSNYPFGVRFSGSKGGEYYIKKANLEFPNVSKATSADWIYNSLLLNSIREGGKAIGIMSVGSSWNTIDKPIREYFIENGYIEAIILLPNRVFASTNIATILIVLSYNNTTIRIIDASNEYAPGRRQNEITDDNIDNILRFYESDSEYSATFTIDEVREAEYNLNPQKWFEKEITIKNGVEFGSVIKKITRGASIKASELDNIVSDSPTDYKYMMLSNIQNGIIDNKLPYITGGSDEKYDKYCPHNRALLMSKNGSPYKIAVFEETEDAKVIANGNLYIIELDEEKVNPYFLQAFFESATGELILKHASVGSNLPIISVESLKKMIIPLPNMEIQNEIASEMKAKNDEIRVLELRLANAIESIRNVYEEGC